MTDLINKVLILLCCLFIYLGAGDDLYMVVPLLVVLLLSAMASLWDSPAGRITPILLWAGLALFFTQFLYFAPLLLYDVFRKPYALTGLGALLPAAVHFAAVPRQSLLILGVLVCFAYVLKFYAVGLEGLKASYLKMRDDTKELEFTLEQKNKELLEKQDYEIKLATLNERNRIAREIHDSVGHVMSSSILQVGALIATVRDDRAREGLLTLKNTLTQGLNSIRDSVHDLHQEAIDLEAQLYQLVKDFTFCPLSLEYEAQTSPSQKTIYSVLAIVKEALANIIKHSQATSASLAFRELPGFYQLIISDNGSPREDQEPTEPAGGMGIRNMKARVHSLNGHFHLDTAKGFRIFISLPKEIKDEPER